MAEPRTLLLLCVLVLCLSDSSFIRGQTVSGSQGQGTGRDHDSLCMDVLGWGYQSSWYLSELPGGPGTQTIVPPPQAEVYGCST
jgi:hypothetical protein